MGISFPIEFKYWFGQITEINNSYELIFSMIFQSYKYLIAYDSNRHRVNADHCPAEQHLSSQPVSVDYTLKNPTVILFKNHRIGHDDAPKALTMNHTLVILKFGLWRWDFAHYL